MFIIGEKNMHEVYTFSIPTNKTGAINISYNQRGKGAVVMYTKGTKLFQEFLPGEGVCITYCKKTECSITFRIEVVATPCGKLSLDSFHSSCLEVTTGSNTICIPIQEGDSVNCMVSVIKGEVTIWASSLTKDLVLSYYLDDKIYQGERVRTELKRLHSGSKPIRVQQL